MASPSRPSEDAWKRCSTCRGPIAYSSTYYVCSVSTCNRKRTAYRFCSVECWEEHLPLMRHREAWAVEEKAPSKEAWLEQTKPAPAASSGKQPTVEVAPAVERGGARDGAPRRRIRVGSAPRPAAAEPGDDVLVVVSRFKSYVKERFGMNTSDAVMEVLSDHIRSVCRRAAENARADGRKTVMDRDFEFLRRR